MRQLVLQKLGLGPTVSSPAIDHGNFYEIEALRVYEQVTGNVLVDDEVGWCKGASLIEYNDCIVPDFVGATPDGLCRDVPILVEIKCPFWKQEITGGIPDIYWPQVQCQMAVMGIHTVHLVRYIPPDLINPGEIVVVEAQFDPEWWSVAVQSAVEFFKHMQAIRLGMIPAPQIETTLKKKAAAEV